MNKITQLLDKLNPAKLVPNLDNLIGKIDTIIKWAIMAGPVILLVLGLIYIFIPPKEANHSFGFRTYFGMGSVEAWRFTQRISGIVLGALGLVLTIVMAIILSGWKGLNPIVVLDKATRCLIWEIALAAISYLGLIVFITIRYDRNGNLRSKKVKE